MISGYVAVTICRDSAPNSSNKLDRNSLASGNISPLEYILKSVQTEVISGNNYG